MKVHFIAIGGSAMHNLAIALSRKGDVVTGSDDEIFEPSKGRLEREGILPESIGWFPDRITPDLDAVILGMHARGDNPELQRAKKLGLPIFSYPEYLYEQAKHKKRIVIGGSHGKTTITSMILHVCKVLNRSVDYMVGAQLEGYDCMVNLTEENEFVVLEGDEYLSSPIDLRPKFHLYKPNIALISGIAWDHINVFPTFDYYVEQFRVFCQTIEQNGVLVYNHGDEHVRKLSTQLREDIQAIAYDTPEYLVTENGVEVTYNDNRYCLQIFGQHNLQNMLGAMHVCQEMNIRNSDFFDAMESFTGAGKRLEKVDEWDNVIVFKDFAHSPSKLKATTSAVKERYPDREVVACMELHTFSSLRKDFLPLYDQAMDAADHAMVYYNPKVVAHKKLAPITPEDVKRGFGGNVLVANTTFDVLTFIKSFEWNNKVLLLMSSGNFDGVDYNQLTLELKDGSE
jgi:UDP-N-acetylmuramate: L-alanyl-gamma-D-glutamyl-meso-diaminopimelate ligase